MPSFSSYFSQFLRPRRSARVMYANEIGNSPLFLLCPIGRPHWVGRWGAGATTKGRPSHHHHRNDTGGGKHFFLLSSLRKKKWNLFILFIKEKSQGNYEIFSRKKNGGTNHFLAEMFKGAQERREKLIFKNLSWRNFQCWIIVCVVIIWKVY